MIPIVIYLNKGLLLEVEGYAEENGFNRSQAVRKILNEKFKRILLKHAYYNDKKGILRSRK